MNFLFNFTSKQTWLVVFVLFTCWSGVSGAEQSVSNNTIDFARDVRPILSQHCFFCHGPDEKKRKGKLRLDHRDSAIAPAKSDAIAIVPGKPQVSELIKRILTDDEDDLMPPVETKKPLNDKQKEILRRWIAEGAEYQPHWAFAAPVAAKLPAVKNKNWVKNDLDHFVLARLEKEGLTPSSEADKYTLIRRVSLDLIGLPPTPQEVDVFIADTSPQAYEKLVDRLLASPHYGERWARQWLDLARYADTNGYEKDRPRSMWPWRDWVINALNADMPFDQFTIKQIAGDLLPNATQDDRIATGFHRNTMINEEGGIDPLEYRFHSMTDRMDTTGKTWLGLTTGCAQCHTHKFDPITQTEYYQLMALMNNADEIVMPIIPNDYDKKKADVAAKIAAIIPTLINKYPVESRVYAEGNKISVSAASGEKAKVQADGIIVFSEDGADRDTYTITIDTDLNKIGFVQLEAIPDKKNPKGGVGRAQSGNFVLNEFSVAISPRDAATDAATDAAMPVKLTAFKADGEQEGFEAKFAIDGDEKTGWGVDGAGKINKAKTATVTLEQISQHDHGHRVVITMKQLYGSKHTLRRFRIKLGYDDPSRNTPAMQHSIAEAAFAAWMDEQRKYLVNWKALKPQSATSEIPTLTILPDDSVLSSGDITKSDTYKTIYDYDMTGVTAIRLETLTDDSLPQKGPGRAYYEGRSGDFVLNDLKLTLDGRVTKFARAAESFANGNNNAEKVIDDDLLTGWTITKDGGIGQAHAALFVFDKPLTGGKDIVISMLMERHYAAAIGRYRFSVTTEQAPEDIVYLPAAVERLLMKESGSLSATELTVIRNYWLSVTPELENARQEIKKLNGSLDNYPTTLVFKERPANHTRPTYIHNRGEYLQPTDKVEPGVFSILNPLPTGAHANRLGLAQWLVARNNPLTARVTVNRWWGTLFGQGLVKSTEDFGYQSEYPSHPALLDYLAVTFMEDGWSMKRFYKRLVMSATYRQQSTTTPELYKRDPSNKLLAHGPRHRIEAELIRDSLLTASGQLSHKLGGPSVFPPQPASVTSEGNYGQFRWKTSEGEDRYRRGLYTYMKRTTPFAMSSAFDAPSGESCIAKREISNSPLQALMLLNDTVVIEAAQALGRHIAQVPGDDSARITTLVRHCLVRPPTAEEIQAMSKFINQQRQRLENKTLDAAVLAGSKDGDVKAIAAWTLLARVVMNTDEFITKE